MSPKAKVIFANVILLTIAVSCALSARDPGLAFAILAIAVWYK